MTEEKKPGVAPILSLPVVPAGSTRESLAEFAGPRPWVVRNLLLRRSVTLLTGKGGFGKSVMALSLGVCCAAGVGYAWWDAPRRPLKVLVLNGEDDHREQVRRVLAITSRLGLSPEQVGERLRIVGDEELRSRGIKLFKNSEERKQVRQTVVSTTSSEKKIVSTDLMVRLTLMLTSEGYDLVIVDPLVQTHDSDENDNTAMEQVMAGFRGLSRKLDVPVLVVHHDRKGATDSNDAGRGASSIVDNVRLAVTLQAMSEEEAEAFKVEDRTEFYQVLSGKANYAPKFGGRWLRMEGVEVPEIRGEDGRSEWVGVPVPAQLSLPEMPQLDSWEHTRSVLRIVGEKKWGTSEMGAKSGHLWHRISSDLKMNEGDVKKVLEHMLAERFLKKIDAPNSNRVGTRQVWAVGSAGLAFLGEKQEQEEMALGQGTPDQGQVTTDHGQDSDKATTKGDGHGF